MSSRKHWLEAVAEELQADLGKFADASRMVFSELHPPPPKPPSTKERVTKFLQMGRDERQQLYANMPPEDYQEFMDKMVNDMHKVLGPAAGKLLPYMYADGIPQQDMQDAEAQATDFLNRISAGDMDSSIEEDIFGENQ